MSMVPHEGAEISYFVADSYDMKELASKASGPSADGLPLGVWSGSRLESL